LFLIKEKRKRERLVRLLPTNLLSCWCNGGAQIGNQSQKKKKKKKKN